MKDCRITRNDCNNIVMYAMQILCLVSAFTSIFCLKQHWTDMSTCHAIKLLSSAPYEIVATNTLFVYTISC